MTALAIAALLVSFFVLAGMVGVLVMLRKGEGPTYSTSRSYDANRREAVRLLTGDEVDRVPGEQWYDPGRDEPAPSDPLSEPYRAAVEEALRAVVPPDRGLMFDGAGRAHLAAEETWVVPVLSTADFREEDLAAWDERGRMTIGLVLFNPEPPGGDTRRVTLPIQVVFPALRRAGRDYLVERFERLRERASAPGRAKGER